MLSQSHDVVVVGGGPAGSTAAAYLARLGYDVLLLERERFPRHHVGESLLPSLMPILEDFGLVPEMERLGFSPKNGGAFLWGRDRETPWEVRFSVNPFLPASKAYHVERSVFDHMLLKHAREVGAQVVEEAKVTDVLQEDGRVCGVRWSTADGTARTARARFVIDASGSRAVVARQLTARHYDEQMRQMAFYSYWRGIAGVPEGNEHLIYILSSRRGWFWFIPLANSELGEVSVGFVTGQEYRDEYAAEGPEAFYRSAIDETPLLKQFLGERATRSQPMRTISDWSYTSERAAGPGWFAAGDAAAFLDPLFSTGVSLAMLAGYSASVCIHSVLSEPGMAEADVQDFFNGNYRQMYDVTRDFIHYFYASNTQAGSDEMFWKARETLQLDDNVGAHQAFCWLINTVPANPHPALERQIQMYQNFMKQVEHPVEQLQATETFQRYAEEVGQLHPWTGDEPDAIPVVNGTLASSYRIDRARHRLEPVHGVRFDDKRPVFSSTTSWLLGHNLAPVTPAQWALLQAIDGEHTLAELAAREARTDPRPADAILASWRSSLHALAEQGFVLRRTRPLAS